jgi:hypothetical protein
LSTKCREYLPSDSKEILIFFIPKDINAFSSFLPCRKQVGMISMVVTAVIYLLGYSKVPVFVSMVTTTKDGI